jgi:hypothetical protein
MERSDAARAWIVHCKDLDRLGHDDGIRYLPGVRGAAAAVDRLRAMLIRAFSKKWTAASEAKLLQHAGCDCLPLAQWLRDKNTWPVSKNAPSSGLYWTAIKTASLHFVLEFKT